jgi:hypothetical protein
MIPLFARFRFSISDRTPGYRENGWRNSLARRALRLSLGQLATAQSLPHANDDHPSTAPASRSHSRSTSADSVLLSSLSHGVTDMPSLRLALRRCLSHPPRHRQVHYHLHRLCHQYQFLRPSLLYHAQRHSSNAYASTARLRVTRRPALLGA